MEGRAERFRHDLDSYVQYRRLCDGVELTYDQINLEELMGYLDIEHHLGLRGSDTWSDQGNEGQVVIKTLIGQILSEKTPAAGAIPQIYLDFARCLKPGDYVLTFNYDILLERALEQARVPYRLFPDRFREVGEFLNTVDDSQEEVVVLKVHGSVDWFDDQRYRRMRQLWVDQGMDPDKARDPIFGRTRPWTLTPLVDGPRSEGDPLQSLYRLRDVEEYYEDPSWFISVPSLISPSTQKLIYANIVRSFWNGLGQAGGGNFRLVIIGYSLPEHDDYARQVIYRIVQNYQQATSELADMLNVERDPILIVDYRLNQDEISSLKKRFAFVDWSKATLYGAGFDRSVIARLSPP